MKKRKQIPPYREKIGRYRDTANLLEPPINVKHTKMTNSYIDIDRIKYFIRNIFSREDISRVTNKLTEHFADLPKNRENLCPRKFMALRYMLYEW